MEKVRCINLDWLEVYCLENKDVPRDADYFEKQGCKVKRRAYGTPQYSEMFTIICDGVEFLEIRRDPYSKRKSGGIFEDNACHIRLANRTCYEPAPIDHLRAFLIAHDYTFKSITRIDMAWDFCEFDDGTDPFEFLKAYIKNDISKVYQSRVAAHGTDTWEQRVWNSVKWGSPSSAITTKLYNKSLELRQKSDKPYIRDVWKCAGLDYGKDVWRIEFSLNSQMQTVKDKREGIVQKHSLCSYDNPERLWRQFMICYNRYFDFRHKETIEVNGVQTLRRKYDCKRLELLERSNNVPFVMIRNPTKQPKKDRTIKILVNKLMEMMKAPDATTEECTAIYRVISSMNYRFSLGLQIERRYVQENLRLYNDLYEKREEVNFEERRKRKDMLLLEAICKKYGLDIRPTDCPF